MSTGEVMGISPDFGTAFYKAEDAANQMLPKKGKVFISVQDSDKRNIIFLAKKLYDMGFKIVATQGTAKILKNSNMEVEVVRKMHEGSPSIMDMVSKKEIDLIINTPSPNQAHYSDGAAIRSAATMKGIPCITTLAGAQASVNGIESMMKKEITVKSIQEYYEGQIK